MFKDYYDEKRQDRWFLNIMKVMAGEIDSNKVNNISKQTGVSSEEIISRIKAGDRLVARLLCKDPSRQSIAEECQKDYITSLVGARFVDLPIGQLIYESKDGRKTQGVDAVIDGYWYATMKVVHGQGSSQTRQRNEAKEFIRISQEVNPKGVMVIIDEIEGEDISHFNKLILPENKARVRILSSDNFKNFKQGK